jgi:hypothetical protein
MSANALCQIPEASTRLEATSGRLSPAVRLKRTLPQQPLSAAPFRWAWSSVLHLQG